MAGERSYSRSNEHDASTDMLLAPAAIAFAFTMGAHAASPPTSRITTPQEKPAGAERTAISAALTLPRHGSSLFERGFDAYRINIVKPSHISFIDRDILVILGQLQASPSPCCSRGVIAQLNKVTNTGDS